MLNYEKESTQHLVQIVHFWDAQGLQGDSLRKPPTVYH